MGFVAARIACRERSHFGLRFVERGGESPKVAELPAIDFHDSSPLFGFDTFYELADARKLRRIDCGDQLVLESVEAFMRRIDRHEWSRCPYCGKGQFVSTAPIAPALTSRTSPALLPMTNAGTHHIGRPHRHAKRLTPAPARLQSP